jgi:hypothetical protein
MDGENNERNPVRISKLCIIIKCYFRVNPRWDLIFDLSSIQNLRVHFISHAMLASIFSQVAVNLMI